MCGIIGYCGTSEAQKIIFDSLKRLEYRGYDSAGIAILTLRGQLKVHKTKGRIEELAKITPLLHGTLAIGHTRWATHGKPSNENAHPFLSCDGTLTLVHNGIIENYLSLRKKLIKKGHKFCSETDSEVLVHLIEDCYDGKLENAVIKALSKVKGSYAIVVLHSKEKKLVGARLESPLVIGVGDKEYFIASDVPAFLQHTRKAIFLEDNESVVLDSIAQSITIKNLNNKILRKELKEIPWSIRDAEKSGYKHFMLKEIYEQPKSLHETLGGRISELGSEVILEELSEQ